MLQTVKIQTVVFDNTGIFVFDRIIEWDNDDVLFSRRYCVLTS